MESFARQMGYFPPREGLTGPRGIHRDLVSNGALDIQLSLALKFNRQVIRIWKTALKNTREKDKRGTCESDQECEGCKLTLITQGSSWAEDFILLPIDNTGTSDDYIMLA